jgi:hypothetical protein
MNVLPPNAFRAQQDMRRQMRINSLGPTAYALLVEINQAVELPPDLEARIHTIQEFVRSDD